MRLKRNQFLLELEEAEKMLSTREYGMAEDCIRICRELLLERKKLCQNLIVLDLYTDSSLKTELLLDSGRLNLVALEMVFRKLRKLSKMGQINCSSRILIFWS